MKKISEITPVTPAILVKGDTIGLIAPAGPVLSENEFQAGAKILAEMGFRIKSSRNLRATDHYLAGSDQQRATDFCDLWQDPKVKAIMAVRGGYGSIRMLPMVKMDLVRQNPKIFIGFSDVSVLLNNIFTATGVITFHGPMLTTLPRSDQDSLQSLFDLLTRPPLTKIKPSKLEIITPGKAQGILLGGNLTTLSQLLATPYEQPWQDIILFIEDVGEAPYRIDRMLTQLKESGRLDKLSGLIMGSFYDGGNSARDDTELIWQRAKELSEDKFPVWANFPIGHTARNQIIPIGIRAEMDSDHRTLHFKEPATRLR
ncbi:MAG: LD-carboxypeptidase [Proteobacteria bacterium]|nr:LD-carboxypeptidase [Pseudomonadota bacterium]MBU1715593.1 LD-carboxypeptidase [Pseudomonadota bacterium]